MRRVVFDSRYVQIAREIAQPIVRITRSDLPFATLREATASYEGATAALAPLVGLDLAVLIDARLAPMRNDAQFERIMARHREFVLGNFRRVAVVVATPIGKVQVDRYARAGTGALAAFSDEAAALAYLLAK